MGHFYSEDKTLLHLKVRRSSGLCLILWICLTSSSALTFFFNVFCYDNNARFSEELKTLRLSQFDFSKENKQKEIFFANNLWNCRTQHSHSLKCISNRKRKLTKDTGKNVKAHEVKPINKIRQTLEDLRTYDFVHCGGKWWNCLQYVVKFILTTKFTLICFHDYNKLTDRNAVSRESLPDDPALVSCAQRRLCFHFPLKLLA